MAELEAELGTRGVSAGLRWSPTDPARQAQGAVLDRGMGREGHGRPCYCWQEVAPFFPDGETEAQGGLETCPRSLTVSQLLGIRGQLTF